MRRVRAETFSHGTSRRVVYAWHQSYHRRRTTALTSAATYIDDVFQDILILWSIAPGSGRSSPVSAVVLRRDRAGGRPA